MDVLAPSAGIDVGLAVISDVAPEGGPGVIWKAALVAWVSVPELARSV